MLNLLNPWSEISYREIWKKIPKRGCLLKRCIARNSVNFHWGCKNLVSKTISTFLEQSNFITEYVHLPLFSISNQISKTFVGQLYFKLQAALVFDRLITAAIKEPRKQHGRQSFLANNTGYNHKMTLIQVTSYSDLID